MGAPTQSENNINNICTNGHRNKTPLKILSTDDRETSGNHDSRPLKPNEHYRTRSSNPQIINNKKSHESIYCIIQSIQNMLIVGILI